MQVFDEQIAERLTAIRRDYIARGIAVDMEQHNLTVDFGSINPNAISAAQTIRAPLEGQYWIFAWSIDYQTQAAPAAPLAIDPSQSSSYIGIRTGQNLKRLGKHVIPQSGDAHWLPIATCFGTGTAPFVLPFPLMLQPNDYLILELASPAALAGRTILARLTTIGIKATLRKAPA